MNRVYIFIGLLLCPLLSLIADEPRAGQYQLSISGPIAKLLPEDTQLRIWNPSPTSTDMHFKLSELPKLVPAEKIDDKDWNVGFTSPSRGYLFSVSFSKERLKKLRPLEIVLSQPDSAVTLTQNREIRLIESLGSDMTYHDLPRWDESKKTLVQPTPPTLVIYSIDNEKPEFSGEMVEGCVGTRWWNPVSENLRKVLSKEFRYVVTHDSGGLFKQQRLEGIKKPDRLSIFDE